jgi:hypothetical protein
MEEKATNIRDWVENVKSLLSDLENEDFEGCQSAEDITEKIGEHCGNIESETLELY